VSILTMRKHKVSLGSVPGHEGKEASAKKEEGGGGVPHSKGRGETLGKGMSGATSSLSLPTLREENSSMNRHKRKK